MMWGDGMGWGMGLWLLFWFLLIVGAILLVVVLVRAYAGGQGSQLGQRGSAGPQSVPRRSREILEERYARGEISTEEYRDRLRTLEEGDR